jgi:hypothetical protein
MSLNAAVQHDSGAPRTVVLQNGPESDKVSQNDEGDTVGLVDGALVGERVVKVVEVMVVVEVVSQLNSTRT